MRCLFVYPYFDPSSFRNSICAVEIQSGRRLKFFDGQPFHLDGFSASFPIAYGNGVCSFSETAIFPALS